MAVFLEKGDKGTEAVACMTLFNTGYLGQDQYLFHDTHLEVECNTDNKMPKNS